MGDRVFITGAGCVLPGATGREELAALLAGAESRLAPLTRGRSLLAATVDEFHAARVPARSRRRMNRIGTIAAVAALQALEDARLEPERMDLGATGISLGTGLGCPESVDRFFTQLVTDGPELVDPSLYPTGVPNAIASQVAMLLGLGGPNVTVSQREVSGEAAIALGADWIRRGRACVVLVGGADELTTHTVHYVHSLGQLAPPDGAVRPLDPDAHGTGLGEGAAFLVLEGEGTASDPLAEVVHVGAGAAPVGAYEADPEGAVLAGLLAECVERAGAFPEILYLGANGHPPLDRAHAAALRAVLGDAPTRVATPKAILGESFSTGVAMAVAACHDLAPDRGIGPVFVAGTATGGAAACVALSGTHRG